MIVRSAYKGGYIIYHKLSGHPSRKNDNTCGKTDFMTNEQKCKQTDIWYREDKNAPKRAKISP
jgi:hypothetical protein